MGGHQAWSHQGLISLLSDFVSINFSCCHGNWQEVAIDYRGCRQGLAGSWTGQAGGTQESLPNLSLPPPTSWVLLCHQPQEQHQTPLGASHLFLGDVGHLTPGGMQPSRCSGRNRNGWGRAWRVPGITPAWALASQGRFAPGNLMWAPPPFPARRHVARDAGGEAQPPWHWCLGSPASTSGRAKGCSQAQTADLRVALVGMPGHGQALGCLTQLKMVWTKTTSEASSS